MGTFSKAQEAYWQAFQACVSKLQNQESIEVLAQRIFRSLESGGIFHVFGSGHSHIVAEELFHRAGGLVPINALLEDYLMPHKSPSRVAALERSPGVAKGIFRSYDLQAGEVLLLVSNSGRNAVTVELAQLAKEKGLQIAALTSLEHSRAVRSGGDFPKLFELADIVIDTGTPLGDACVRFENLDVPVCALSGAVGSFFAQILVARICELYTEAEKTPPVYQSANTPNGDERNQELEKNYKTRIAHL